MGLKIKNGAVGGKKVTMENAETLEWWNISAAYQGQWSIA
jgi:hypothetical protein